MELFYDRSPSPHLNLGFGNGSVLLVYQVGSVSKVDGNVHTMPTSGPPHEESEDCWCEPEMIGDYSEQGGAKHFLHKEIQ